MSFVFGFPELFLEAPRGKECFPADGNLRAPQCGGFPIEARPLVSRKGPDLEFQLAEVSGPLHLPQGFRLGLQLPVESPRPTLLP